MATPNYDIDYNDKRLVEVNTNKNEALTQNEKLYNDAIAGVDSKYNALIDASKNYAEEQKKNQQEQTDFAIEQIEQQKGQAQKDYIKEQSGAYVDFQKERDSYGAGAEQRAAAGLAGAGYSESAQVSIYNTYQNRVATAREAYGRAVLNYDNAIKDARLQNSSILAEIAYKALQQQLELSLQGFQYKNQLIIEKANKKLEIDNMYHGQYMNVLDQINKENSLAEQVRQYNKSMAFQREQAQKEQNYRNAQLALEREKFNYQKAQAAASSGGGSSGGSTTSKKSSSGGSSSTSKSSSARSSGSARTAYANRGFTGSTYKEANDYLKKNGAGDYNLMTESEWKRRKSSYNRTGVGGYEVSANGSYSDYLKTATAYAIKNK